MPGRNLAERGGGVHFLGMENSARVVEVGEAAFRFGSQPGPEAGRSPGWRFLKHEHSPPTTTLLRK